MNDNQELKNIIEPAETIHDQIETVRQQADNWVSNSLENFCAPLEQMRGAKLSEHDQKKAMLRLSQIEHNAQKMRLQSFAEFMAEMQDKLATEMHSKMVEIDCELNHLDLKLDFPELPSFMDVYQKKLEGVTTITSANKSLPNQQPQALDALDKF